MRQQAGKSHCRVSSFLTTVAGGSWRLCETDRWGVIVEHRERLFRFGFEYVEAALSAHGCSVVVTDNTDLEDTLVEIERDRALPAK